MPHPPSCAPDNIKYYSAYRGPVLGADGNFDHFARQCESVHVKNGYWRFSTDDDDRRAFTRGLNNPEEVLKAQDSGEGDYEDIVLRWVPGELDESNKPREGSARAHLQTICEERRLLGKSLSFRGAVPLYPFGASNPELFRHRVVKWGLQKGLLPKHLLSPAPPARRSYSTNMASIPSAFVSSSSSSKTGNPAPASVPAPSATVQDTQNEPDQTSRSDLDSAGIVDGHMSGNSSPPVSVGRPVHSDHQTQYNPAHSVFATHGTPQPMQHDSFSNLQSNPQAESVDDKDCAPLGSIAQSLEPQRLEDRITPEGHKDNFQAHGSDETDSSSTYGIEILSLTAATPADFYHAQVAALPCMDCGLVEAHTSGCWISKAEQSLKPPENLTTAELEQLVDDVNGFDPAPWTTHFGPPEAVVEDAETQLRGMAEVIRNLDTTAFDSELQYLDDQVTVLLWLFKSIGEVKILEVGGEQMEV